MNHDAPPICGPHAVCETTGVDLETVLDYFRARKSKAWNGGTRWSELRKAVKDLANARWKDMPRPRGSLKTFVENHLPVSGGRSFIVRVGGHFVAVINGRVIDQYQAAPVADHWAARKRPNLCAEVLL